MTRRGLILIGVLVIVALGALIGTTLIVGIGAERSLIEGSLGRERSHAMAWSGVLAAMTELDDQRDLLLAGEDAELTEEWTMIEADAAGRGVVRLVPFATGELVRPESAYADINAATAEGLAALPGLSSTAAEAIVAARGSGPFGSVDELAREPGLASLLTEPVAAGIAADPFGSFAGGSTGGSSPVTAAANLTSFAFDPEQTVGLSETETEAGLPRVVLREPWTEEIQADLEALLGPDLGVNVGGGLRSGELPGTWADLTAVLLENEINADQWGLLFDSVTYSPDPFSIGKIDINRASAEVLASLPGIDAALAQAIVAARDRLDAAQRRSVAWPLSTGELTPAEFAAIAPSITVRTTVWSVRIEAGFDPSDREDAIDEGFALPESDAFGVAVEGVSAESTLRHRVVLEAVIDVSADRPRIAYLRDVTDLELVTALRTAVAARDADAERARPERRPDDEAGDGVDELTGDADPTRRFRSRERELPPVRRERPTSDRGRDASETDPETTPPDEDGSPAPGSVGPPGVDRRVGRWTPRPAASGERP